MPAPSIQPAIDHCNNASINNNNMISTSSTSLAMQLDDDDEKLQEENGGTPSSTPPLVTATTTSSRQQQQQQTSNQNVGELVVKAKKAAASLWMILHAQVRVLKLMSHFFLLCPVNMIWHMCSILQ